MVKKKTVTGKKPAPARKMSSARKTQVSRKPTTARRKTRGAKANPKGAGKNKGMAVIAYILFFIPLLTGAHKKSPFVKFHTNQGTVFFLFSVPLWIATAIITTILFRMFLGLPAIVFGLLTPLISIVILVLLIIGIIHALSGKMKPLPLIGKFTIIK
jgi:uncharacterized membrane protein